jgi:hypothetical protein
VPSDSLQYFETLFAKVSMDETDIQKALRVLRDPLKINPGQRIRLVEGGSASQIRSNLLLTLQMLQILHIPDIPRPVQHGGAYP